MGQLRIYRDGVSIVTGAASGIGRALALELGKRGCFVVVADIRSEDARETADRIIQNGGRARPATVDVADCLAVERLVSETFAQEGRLDFLFNNAGVALGGETHLHAISHWNTIIDVNLRGVVHGVWAACPIMRRQGFGHIVNTASMAALIPTPIIAAYSMTKHGVLGLTKALRPEAATWGVRVSVICPGIIRSNILEHSIEKQWILSDDPDAVEKIRELWSNVPQMDADRFARYVLDKTAANRYLIIAPRRWRLAKTFHELFPNLGMWIARKIFERVNKKLKAKPGAPVDDHPSAP